MTIDTIDDLDRALAERGVGDRAGVLAALLQALDVLTDHRGPAVEEPRRHLSRHEQQALVAVGFNLEPGPKGVAPVAVVRAAARFAALRATALSVRQAAERLGVDTSSIRRRLGDRTLYGIKADGRWLLPAFQFDGDALVPNTERALAALPVGVHPVAVANWFLRPDPDLELAGEPVAPRDWLLVGNDPEPVVALAAAL